MRGSFSSPIDSESTSLSASFTLRIRSLISASGVVEREDLALHQPQLECLAPKVALGPVEEAEELVVPARDAGEREARTLPHVVVVDLGHRGPEAPLELRLDGEELLALALERMVLGEVELGRENADVAGAHGSSKLLALVGLGRGLGCGSGRRAAVRHLEVGALDLPRLVGFEDVAFLDVVEALEQDAALEALLHLADVVLEALEACDRRLVDDRALADDADLRVPADDAVRDVAAGDHAQARGAEERAHLGLAECLFALLRGEHADERLAAVVRELVDDPVRAQVDALALGERARLRVGAHVEAEHDRVR